MITLAHPHRAERLSDASVVPGAAELAGARHEVLPPRRATADGAFPWGSFRAEPP
ncbi:hypothetical protein IF188_13255 [Microbacterium sp. NEAU-LLC]|uniref:Uncharacterized protein n=1 Tax=Microbacterium helvum TaxID=2773713 RepID=A0ABR8NPT1_9MICO|nr:hypothetical protein [Microbacterium helvum]MBD3942664.1 hypothetical protein [Microbacterium helvum]